MSTRGFLSHKVSILHILSILLFILYHGVHWVFVLTGLDVHSQNVIVDWSIYLQLYCIFEAGQVEKSSLIRFWIKFFD